MKNFKKEIDKDTYIKAIYDISPSIIGISRVKDGVFVDVNKSFTKILGYSKEEVIGKSSLELNFWHDIKDRQKIIKKLKKYGIVKEIEIDLLSKDNTKIIGLGSMELLNENYLVCIFEDITERKKSEQILKESAKELIYNNEELEQFAYAASHDLQEPLRVVSSYCQLMQEFYLEKLQEKTLKEDQDEIELYLKFILEAVERMKYLIKDLLEFSKVGRIEKTYEIVDVNNVITETIKDFSTLIKDNNIKINYKDLPTIVFKSRRISQIFHNLISNSIKFRKKDGNNCIINIGYQELEEEWIFTVKDNGIGINNNHFDKIFGLFKRLYTKEEYPGTGIGLALVKKIVENEGGRIWVESTVGIGTIFYFSIPRGVEIN